jgi:hypothetical protein
LEEGGKPCRGISKDKVIATIIFLIESLPVSFTLLRNFPVSNAFSSTPTQAGNSCSMPETNAQYVSPTVTSDVIITQVGATRMTSLQTNPISLNFAFETTQNNTSDDYYQCAYWNFSDL